MNFKLPILSIAAIIHIICSVLYYLKNGMQNDHEGWGKLATLVLVGAGFAGIIIDIGLYKRIKSSNYMTIATLLIVAGYIYSTNFEMQPAGYKS